jgi:hypothetical protein
LAEGAADEAKELVVELADRGPDVLVPLDGHYYHGLLAGVRIDSQARQTMARKPKSHSQSANRVRRLPVFSYVTLEGRLAPGSLLDPGLAPVSPMLQELESGASQYADEGHPRSRSHALAVKSSRSEFLDLSRNAAGA